MTSEAQEASVFNMAQQAAQQAPSQPSYMQPDAARSAVDQFRAESRYEPFREQLPDGTVLEVPWPTGSQMARLQKASDEVDAQMILLGDQYQRWDDTVGQLPFPETMKVVQRMMEHFGLGESNA